MKVNILHSHHSFPLRKSLVHSQHKIAQVCGWFSVPCRASQGGSRRMRTDLRFLYWFHRFRWLTIGSDVRNRCSDVYIGLLVFVLTPVCEFVSSFSISGGRRESSLVETVSTRPSPKETRAR